MTNDEDTPLFTLKWVLDLVFGFFAALGLIGTIIVIGFFWGTVK